MLKETIFHRAVAPYVYSDDEETVQVMLRTKKADVDIVTLLYGDPYHFEGDYWCYAKTPMEKTGTTKYYDYWKIAIKPSNRRLRYGFLCQKKNENPIIYTERGFSDTIPTDVGSFFCFPYLHKQDTFQAPSWVKDTVWYQIFPERFANGDPSTNPEEVLPWGSVNPKQNSFFGGDFQGIMDHLDYLEELGITGIYLCPIFKAYSNHKYDTIDYFEIDPQFGDKKIFRELVQQCHQRGIRIMLDAVFNHSGYYFEPFQDVLAKGERSEYKDWFHIWDFPVQTEPMPNYDTFGFVSTMPKLNTANPDVKQYLLEVASYWIKEFDIDGWRLDVANEIDHVFWRDFRNAVKDIKQDAYILGEIWHDSLPWLQGDQFDAVMNYPFTTSVVDFFAKARIDAGQFMDQITDLLHKYPGNVNKVAFNLLDSHDTARILTLANNEKARVRLMYVFQFSFIGTPCIYYGDEIGMSGGEDPDCRGCMEWNTAKQDQALFGFVRQLITMRKEIPAFGNQSSFRILETGYQKNVIVYEKQQDQEKLIFILNNDAKVNTVAVNALNGVEAKEHFSGRQIIFKDKATVELAPFGYVCFQLL